MCAIHGGRSPQVKAAAERRLLEERAQRELVRFSDAAPVGNPLAELLKLAGEAAAWRQACERRVQALQEVRYESAQRLEQLRAEVGMYERAQRFCLDVNAAVTRLDIDERLARVKEAVAQMLSAALAGALAGAGLDGEQAQAVRLDFAKRIRVLPATAHWWE